MIGTLREATTILRWYETPKWQKKLPKGWTHVGSGCYRTVYLSPKGVCYKVGTTWSNDMEVKKAKTLSRFTKLAEKYNFRIPKTNAFRIKGSSGEMETIVAMEYIKGKTTYCNGNESTNCCCGYTPCIDSQRGSMSARLSHWVSDMHSANVLVDGNGVLVPVDMGM